MKTNKNNKKLKRLAFDLPQEKHLEIKMAATARGMSIKMFIEEALYCYGQYLQNSKIK